jgi:hypothetical protein
MKHKWGRTLAIGTFALALAGPPGNAAAAPVTLTDRNSSVIIDSATHAGMLNWTVDGTNHLSQQWFWYRLGASGPESPINTLPVLGQVVTNTNFNAGVDTLAVRYGTGDFRVEIRYSLHGGTLGSGTADVSETIRFENHGATPLDVHFYQYNNFDLGGTPNDDIAVRSNANTIQQYDAGSVFAETVSTPVADHFEIAMLPVTRAKLDDGIATTLSDGSVVVGPGDLAWALEWDFTLAAGSSKIISKDKLVVPTQNQVSNPATLLLLGSGLFGTAVFVRRRLA